MFKKYFSQKRLERGRELDPEEIFADSVNIPGHDHLRLEGHIARPLGSPVFFVWGLCIALALFLIAFRLFSFQYLRGEHFSAIAKKNISYVLFSQPSRGIIYDRNMEALASNAASFALVLKRSEVKSDEDFGRTLERGARLVGRPVPLIWFENNRGDPERTVVFPEDLLSPKAWPEEIVLSNSIPRSLLLQIATDPQTFNGLTVEESIERQYEGPAFSHVIGFTGAPTAEDQKRFSLYRSGIRSIGKSNAELIHEEALRGLPGRKVIEIDSEGQPQRSRFIEKPTPGNHVVLNIDADLQRSVYETLARRIPALGKKAGAAVVSDPRDGRILALVSFPSFDAEIIAGGKDREHIRKVLTDPRKALFNRAVAGVYAPGSTVKPILAAAALEEGVIDPKRAIYDEGFISVPNPYDPTKQSIFKDWAKLGWVDMERAIAYSANVYFYTIGGGHNDIKGLGIERIRKFLNLFGFGSILGIDLAGEKKGLVPGPEEKKTMHPSDPFWRLGDTYITAIGQGDTGVTPLQISFAMGAIANGGTLWRPFVTKAILDSSGNIIQEIAPKILRDQLAHPESLSVVKRGMRKTVTEGSAVALADFPLSIAGKTGTAQTGAFGKNHGWFTGFAPLETPEVVVTVLVEEGTGGMTDAVPIAKEVFWAWLNSREVTSRAR